MRRSVGARGPWIEAPTASIVAPTPRTSEARPFHRGIVMRCICTRRVCSALRRSLREAMRVQLSGVRDEWRCLRFILWEWHACAGQSGAGIDVYGVQICGRCCLLIAFWVGRRWGALRVGPDARDD